VCFSVSNVPSMGAWRTVFECVAANDAARVAARVAVCVAEFVAVLESFLARF